MFAKSTNEKKPNTDDIMRMVYLKLQAAEPGTQEFNDLLDNLNALNKIKSTKDENKVSADAIVGAVSSILGILAVLNYERIHVVTSKAFGMIPKSR